MKTTYEDFNKDYDLFTNYVMGVISLKERRKIRNQWNYSNSKEVWQDYLLESVNKKVKQRLEYLRHELRKECISYGDLAELQYLKNYINSLDIELLEASGLHEF